MTPQEKIEPVLADLRKISGVSLVSSDDWDSHYINVIVAMRISELGSFKFGQKPTKFVASIRSVKSAIQKVCDEHNVPVNFLDQPVQQYVYNNNFKLFAGEPKMIKDGYNGCCIKVEMAWN